MVHLSGQPGAIGRGTMPRDTDGTYWMIVRYTIDVDVIADTEDDALYLAELALPDYRVSDWVDTGKVVVK